MKTLPLLLLPLALAANPATDFTRFVGEVTPNTLLETITIQTTEISTAHPPAPLITQPEFGIVTAPRVDAQLIARARDARRGLFEVRGTVTPAGDFLVMYPDGGHYAQRGGKEYGQVNQMLAYRSRDGGETWEGPAVAFDIDYNQHAFIPFIPKNSNRIYAFGTQPNPLLFDRHAHGLGENAPIGYRYSDDDGHTWSEARIIKPKNDPGFRGMSAMRMTETDDGTWLLGSHEADWSYRPLLTRQYVLRSEDKGETWELLPHRRHGGWLARGFNRMDEGRPLNLGDGNVFLMTRTAAGHLWGAWSEDDGQNWTYPAPTSLVHPDAPPMLFKLSDGETLIAFHHNRSKIKTADLTNRSQHYDRSEIWFATSTDGGRSWSEPRFVFATALAPVFDNPWRDFNTSYLDMFVDDGKLHILCPHRWERVLHLTIKESDLENFPTQAEFLTP